MSLLDRIINPLIDKRVEEEIQKLIKESQEHNSVMVGNPLAWSWASTIPDSYYPNAVLRDGTRTLTGNLTADDGIRINIDEIRARDAGGLKLFEDSGVGIFVEDGGNVGIGTTSPKSQLSFLKSSTGITLDTNDASDDGYLAIVGAGAHGTLRGGTVYLSGNERTTYGGSARLVAGTVASPTATSGVIDFVTNDSVRMVIRDTGNVGIGTANPDRLTHSEKLSALTNTIQQVARLTHITSGVSAAGIGLGIEFEQETANDNNEIIAILESVMTDVTGASEDADFVIKLMAGGAAAAEKLRVSSDGYVKPSVGYKSSDGTAGIDATISVLDGNGVTVWDLVFKDGLLVSKGLG